MTDQLENLQVLQKARDLDRVIHAILSRPAFRRHPDLSATDGRIVGARPHADYRRLRQKTDRQYANYVFMSRGEAQEMRGHLRAACNRQCVSLAERDELSGRYHEVVKMLGGLARHLEKEDRKFRA
jgi:hypothetical protein